MNILDHVRSLSKAKTKSLDTETEHLDKILTASVADINRALHTPIRSTRATVIARLFRQFQSDINGIKQWRLTNRKQAWTCFEKCAEIISAYEKNSGTKVNLTRFVRAQFETYGEHTYPSHLISDNAINIYNKFLSNKEADATLSEDDRFASENKMLADLARIRGERTEQTLEMLKDSNMFSSSFLKAKGYKKKNGRWEVSV